ncbi:MAG: protein translocase subunit SecD [Opitutales bacterium]|jgi:SecD/SecF fusion protein
MNGTNLFRLIVTILLTLWAATELMPPTSTPFEAYLTEQVSETIGEDGTVDKTQEQNLKEFAALVERANAKVAEAGGDATSPYATLYTALLRMAKDERIDISGFFSHINMQDIKNLDKKNKILLTELLRRSKGEISLGLDLNGGVAITFEVNEDSLENDLLYRRQQLQDARQVILDRVDGLGVAEPVVRLKGDSLIEVQMPGINTEDNPNIAETIGAPALLEFRLVHRTARPVPGAEAPLGYEVRTQEFEDPQTGEISEEPLYLKIIPIMTGEIIDSARPQITQTGGYEVTMDFTNEGRKQFADATGQIASGNSDFSIGRLAIVLDGKLVSSPTVRERINSNSARITGSFTQREAFELANALNNPLAVEMQVAEMYEVGPTLAKDARDTSIRAGIWGGALVVAFMVIYYGIAGFVSMLTVVLNLFLVLGALASFGATITLPGVAALVLTIGMAVDASILIFERIREELHLGKSLHNAVIAGYDKAFSTIVDANVTTLITALILVWLGTGPVRGFGVTLSAGIIATVFCSLVTSRFILEGLVVAGIVKKAFTLQLFKNTDFSFLNHARKAFISSWILVAVGVGSFIMHKDQAFGIDFTGGDEVSISFDQPITSEQVRAVAAESSFISKDGESLPFGEVNAFVQTPLGADKEVMVVQSETGKGHQFFAALEKAYPDAGLTEIGMTQIGSAVGSEVTKSAIISIVVALLGILIYIAFRFEFGYGLGAVVATIHDMLMTVGIFVTLGEIFGIGSGQFSAPMIAAILMTVGYSINDTIVVFDRVREELELNPGMNLRRIVHLSINRVLNRTVLTSLTTLFASLTLFLFGAGVIKDFALVFLLGILTGTFSSVFIASPVFYWYHKGDRKSVEKGEVIPSYDWTSEKA